MKHLIGQTIEIGGNSYTITKEYVEGAIAFSKGKWYNSNPYHDGTQEFYDWNDGYVNEEDVLDIEDEDEWYAMKAAELAKLHGNEVVLVDDGQGLSLIDIDHLAENLVDLGWSLDGDTDTLLEPEITEDDIECNIHHYSTLCSATTPIESTGISEYIRPILVAFRDNHNPESMSWSEMGKCWDISDGLVNAIKNAQQ